ncbi:MAG: glycosyltransferase family 4 protein [Patescibacteria group bacterium]
MQVAHICCVAPPMGGGMGQVADREVRGLRKHGVDSWLICPRDKKCRYDEHVIDLVCFGFGNAGRLIGLKKRLKEADVVHLHYPFYGTAGCVAAMRKLGIIKKLVITLHMDAFSNGYKGKLFDLHRKLLQDKILKTADAILISSKDYAEHSSFANLIAANDPRVRELPFGVDTDLFTIGLPHRDEFNLPAGSFVVGNVSVMDSAHPFKGLDVLIKSIAKLPSDVHLLLVGDGNRRAFYKNLAHELGIGGRVHFTGRLSNRDLIKAFQTMNLFAFPSTSKAEAFGLAMLEAMACGVPVIAADLPGVRALAKDCGCLVPKQNIDALSEAINKFHADNAMCRQYSSSARAKALQYSWERHIGELIKLYQNLCESPS